jgi:LmbE family N-acetylglucosaminyl deacetylase
MREMALTTVGEVLGTIRTLPHGDLADILKGGTPIILAPHPDDEVIGCGALLADAARSGISPVIVFVTDGSGSHPNSRAYPRDVLAALRQREARAAAAILGVDPARLHFMGIRDTAAPHDGPGLDDAAGNIVRTIAPYDNPVIFAPWAHDPHRDHRAVYKMAVRIARVLAVRHLSYIVWGWLLPAGREVGDFEVSGWRFRGNKTDDHKSRALNAYKSQISDLIHDDPGGFRLDEQTLAAMLSEDEVFLNNP